MNANIKNALREIKALSALYDEVKKERERYNAILDGLTPGTTSEAEVYAALDVLDHLEMAYIKANVSE